MCLFYYVVIFKGAKKDCKSEIEDGGNYKDEITKKNILENFSKTLDQQAIQRIDTIKHRITAFRSDDNFAEVATLGEGASFIEQALINNKPRAASIYCVTPSFFSVMHRKDYEKSFGKIQKKHMEAMTKFYMSCPINHGWTKSQLGRLDYYFKRVNYSMGSAVYRRGQICSHIYIVFQGEFE